ncbi:MAG: DNA-deoxyinosine glycosylase [Gammaproteobacteria bacterium]|nr:DNA-deoxyinosine glycosylase [Gammaproteobacteria bacterium]MDA7969877.1 DNA-deoxyinosine glycosylase [Gammaproteobacteria bacterium]MDA7971013.1 DNA-deoxyinosine glycosylase [Gammaproteobacteria bacterium]MDA7995247.1 DNA-deoxyinosine glycosylase [Gammaproteobacteria bacterium]CAJ2377438.1 MAG: G:T/U mismatch-specific uracil/thymine DNA-glycosylase [Arenicellales bacterium IbO2]
MPDAPRRTGLPPVAGAAGRARVLILGSFPSEASLRAREYYAHPRNQFWPIMEELFGIARAAPYRTRCRQLAARGVALWDVIASCRRDGSLDSNIRAARANDFAAFHRRHPRIAEVFCNGASAERHYRALAAADDMRVTRLPSTSPAHAALSLAAKTAQWAAVRAALARAI